MCVLCLCARVHACVGSMLPLAHALTHLDVVALQHIRHTRKAAALDEEPRQIHRRLFHHLELVLQTPLRIVVASRR